MRSAITAKLPRYIVPLPAADHARPDGASAESAGDVLYLPKMTVRTPRIVPMEGYEFLTLKGKLELARKLYPGLMMGPFAGLNGGVALELLAEDMEIAKRQELTDLAQRTNVTGSAASRATEKELERALQRPNSYWSSGGGHH